MGVHFFCQDRPCVPNVSMTKTMMRITTVTNAIIRPGDTRIKTEKERGRCGNAKLRLLAKQTAKVNK